MAHEKAAKSQPSFEFGGVRTLPLFLVQARLDERLYAYGKAKATIVPGPPDYVPPPFGMTTEWLDSIGKDANVARQAVHTLSSHISNYLYFVQLKDDGKSLLMRKLHSHIDVVILLADARLSLDPAILSACVRQISIFRSIHSAYREDQEREAHYEEHVERLNEAYESLSKSVTKLPPLLQRMSRIIELKSGTWRNLVPLVARKSIKTEPRDVDGINLFYSYSHKDEALRDQLQTHLTLLKREGVIKEWYDRKIGAGSEWRGQIDVHLESARLILLLVSTIFSPQTIVSMLR